MRKYTEKQIREALTYWNRRLREAEDVEEDVNNVMKVTRDAEDAREAAKGKTIEAGDPMAQLVKKHKEAVKAGKKACASEMQTSKKDDKVQFENVIISNSCIRDGHWIGSKDSTMVICAAIHMPTKKGKLSRLFTGSIFKLGKNVGILALQGYVNTFLGKSFAKQVDKKHVFDGIDNEKDRVKYYVAFKLMDKDTKMDEKEDDDAEQA